MPKFVRTSIGIYINLDRIISCKHKKNGIITIETSDGFYEVGTDIWEEALEESRLPANPGFKVVTFEDDGTRFYEDVIAWDNNFVPLTLSCDYHKDSYIVTPCGTVHLGSGCMFKDEKEAYEYWKSENSAKKVAS